MVPEWVPWMMTEVRSRNLEDSVYLWSDDNLSNDYFWQYLSPADLELVANYRNYGKVCCFKGFTPESFSFNTGAAPSLFERQLDLMRRYVKLGIDVYGYITLTTPQLRGIPSSVTAFVDSLQGIHPNLPLRIIPLEIRTFSPVEARIQDVHLHAMENQQVAVAAWQQELQRRFSASDLGCCIADVSLQ